MADETTTTQTTDTQQPATTIGTGAQTAKPEPKFTQEDMDNVAGNRAKEAAANARKAILKELGVDPDDPEAVKAVKGKLTAAQKAEDDKKTNEQRLQDQIDTLTQERDTEKQTRLEVEEKRLADRVDNSIIVKAREALAHKPENVMKWLRLEKTAAVEKLIGEDGTIDDKAVDKLIADFKKEEPTWFKAASGVGSPSVSGGRSLDPASADHKRAQAHSQRTIRG